MNLKCGWWHACYRNKPCGCLIEDKKTPFEVIANNWYASGMDPFVFEYHDETYIFAEIYNIFRQRGTIGYAKYDKKKERFSSWKEVIIEHFHLSYPYIFTYNNEIFMVPESNEGGQVVLYHAKAFPEQWEKVGVLKDRVKYVDTSIFRYQEQDYAFTYDIADQDNKKLLLYALNDDLTFSDNVLYISNDDCLARPGGRIFRHNGKMIRVAQDCGEEYGKAISFFAFEVDSKNGYQETALCHIDIEDVILNRKIPSIGIHNYSATDRFEVIDVKGRMIHPADLLMRCVIKVKNAVCRGKKK